MTYSEPHQNYLRLQDWVWAQPRSPKLVSGGRNWEHAPFTSFFDDFYIFWNMRTAALKFPYIITSSPILLAKEEISDPKKGCSSRTQGWARSGLSKFLKLWNFLLFFFLPRNSIWGQEQTQMRESDALLYWNLLNALHMFFHVSFPITL